MGKDSITGRFSVHRSRRLYALIVVSIGALLAVVDANSVVIALPSIKSDLGFSDAFLAWVVAAYNVTYAGFLLLTGRLGDLCGHPRLFGRALIAFAIASLGCALSMTSRELVVARVMQGLAGAAMETAALSLMMSLSDTAAERARALALSGFVTGAGSAAGLLLSGVLTSAFGWRSIFFINVPIAITAFALGSMLLPIPDTSKPTRRLDLAGATTVTSATLLAVYAILNVNQDGWLSRYTIASTSTAAVLLVVFLRIEAKAREPLVPLGVFKRHNLTVCCFASVLYCAGTSVAVFVSFYLQQVVGVSPFQVGLTFLPYSLLFAGTSVVLSANLTIRFGVKRSMVIGMSTSAAGLILLTRLPVNGHIIADVLPGLLLLGLGSGIAYNPLVVAAMNGMPQTESGLVSGILTTCCTISAALGFALAVSASAVHTKHLLLSAAAPVIALNAGYHVAFFLGAIASSAAAVVTAVVLRTGPRSIKAQADDHWAC